MTPVTDMSTFNTRLNEALEIHFQTKVQFDFRAMAPKLLVGEEL